MKVVEFRSWILSCFLLGIHDLFMVQLVSSIMVVMVSSYHLMRLEFSDPTMENLFVAGSDRVFNQMLSFW